MDRLGGLHSRTVIVGLTVAFIIWILLDVLALGITSGLSRGTYDAMVRYRLRADPPDPRIVIVDIDEASLSRLAHEFGRWPWPRDTLATLLAHIEKDGPVAIVWDIVFSDADTVSPGGDAAFDEAVKQSRHSCFGVVRLPKTNDSLSHVTRRELPGLWFEPTSNANSTWPVAVIPPILENIALKPLGFNNGYVDSDGMLRRFKYSERLPDGTTIQSLPLAVLRIVDPTAVRGASLQAVVRDATNELIVWRKTPAPYPHVRFADVFDSAEGRTSSKAHSFAGKIVIIGATAPSLHDIHPTPLSSTQNGVDTLATVIDNLFAKRHLGELSKPAQAILAIALCIALATWVLWHSVASLKHLQLGLPIVLLVLSYATLNGTPYFIDLHLSAALALLFLTALRVWQKLRRSYWCSPACAGNSSVSLLPFLACHTMCYRVLDQLIVRLEGAAPNCRIMVAALGEDELAWDGLRRHGALVGPTDELERCCNLLSNVRNKARAKAYAFGSLHVVEGSKDSESLARVAQTLWSRMAYAGPLA